MKLRFIADDYGESPTTNAAIAAVCQAGVVVSSTVLAAEECVYSKDHLANINGTSWGAHFYLTEYVPLTDAVRRYYLQCRPLAKRNILAGLATGRLSRNALFLEFEAQLVRLMEYGFPVSFIDTHQNIHGIPPVYRIVKAVAEKYGLSSAIRPIHQLNFSLKYDLKQFVSGLCSRYLCLASDRRVLVGCPCYHEKELNLGVTLAAWNAMLSGISQTSIAELYVPCHPGISPAEMELYSSGEFAGLLHNYNIQVV